MLFSLGRCVTCMFLFHSLCETTWSPWFGKRFLVFNVFQGETLPFANHTSKGCDRSHEYQCRRWMKQQKDCSCYPIAVFGDTADIIDRFAGWRKSTHCHLILWIWFAGLVMFGDLVLWKLGIAANQTSHTIQTALLTLRMFRNQVSARFCQWPWQHQEGVFFSVLSSSYQHNLCTSTPGCSEIRIGSHW